MKKAKLRCLLRKIKLELKNSGKRLDLRRKSYLKKKKDEITIRSSAVEYLIYVASVGDKQDSFEMRYEDENIWLTQKMMATLYDVDVRTINEHIKKICNYSVALNQYRLK